MQEKAVFLCDAERKFYAQKIKCDYILQGDKSSRLFHSFVKRNAERSFISSLIKDDGTSTSSMEEIQEEFLGYYVNLLGARQEIQGFDAIAMDSGPKVTYTQADFLIKRITKEDIKAALFDVGNDRSPEPDRYASYFFKKAWNLEDDFCAAVNEFFETGKLCRQANHSVISLIPKNAHAMTVSDFRPISCCNVFYKVITKLLAARLGVILPNIIEKAQSAFVKGRSVVENIHQTQEIMRGYTRKRTSSKYTLKIDIRKSYDTISREFSKKVLQALDFPVIFIN